MNSWPINYFLFCLTLTFTTLLFTTSNMPVIGFTFICLNFARSFCCSHSTHYQISYTALNYVVQLLNWVIITAWHSARPPANLPAALNNATNVCLSTYLSQFFLFFVLARVLYSKVVWVFRFIIARSWKLFRLTARHRLLSRALIVSPNLTYIFFCLLTFFSIVLSSLIYILYAFYCF